MRRSGESLSRYFGLHRGNEALEADRRQFAQQARHVAEMVLRRRVRYAGLARRRAQGQPLDAVALQDALRRLQQRLAQRAVVIGLRPFRLAHAPARLARRSFRSCLRFSCLHGLVIPKC